MTYITLDTIVKSVLLRRGYPMHWYLQFLKYGADCIRELHFRTLHVVQTEAIVANAGGAIDLPCDYTAWVRIGLMNGQHIVPLVQSNGNFNPLPIKDTKGVVQPYPDPVNGQGIGHSWLNGWLQSSNDLGEFAGGYFGHGAGYETDLFEEMPNRCQIQFSQELAGRTVVLDYVGDASSCCNITRIPAMAQACIEQYIIWQLKEHARHYNKNEAKDEERMYWHEERHLRARLNPITKEDILRIMRRNYHRSAKS